MVRRLFTAASVLSLAVCGTAIVADVASHRTAFGWTSHHHFWSSGMLRRAATTHNHDHWQRSAPLALFAVLGGVLPTLWLLKSLRARRHAARLRAGQCPACGYDLRASTGRCPECGTPMTQSRGAKA